MSVLLQSCQIFISPCYIIIFLAKDCGPIGTPANGTKLGSQTIYPNEVIFSCDDGFHLRGSIRRRCTAGGAWSGVEANCEGNFLLS